jgi:hypothetical protein
MEKKMSNSKEQIVQDQVKIMQAWLAGKSIKRTRRNISEDFIFNKESRVQPVWDFRDKFEIVVEPRIVYSVIADAYESDYLEIINTPEDAEKRRKVILDTDGVACTVIKLVQDTDYSYKEELK